VQKLLKILMMFSLVVGMASFGVGTNKVEASSKCSKYEQKVVDNFNKYEKQTRNSLINLTKKHGYFKGVKLYAEQIKEMLNLQRKVKNMFDSSMEAVSCGLNI